MTDEKTGKDFDVVAALVNNKLKELSYKPTFFLQVQFIGYNHPDGRRAYLRSLCFVMQNAVRELFPDKVLVIDHSLPNGLYCELQETFKREDGRPAAFHLEDEDLERIRRKMEDLISRDLPFTRKKMPSSEAMEIFRRNNQKAKAELQESIGSFTCNVYSLDGNQDSFHGPLIPSTGLLKVFGITPVGDGFCLQPPTMTDFNRVMPIIRQSKIAAALEEE